MIIWLAFISFWFSLAMVRKGKFLYFPYSIFNCLFPISTFDLSSYLMLELFSFPSISPVNKFSFNFSYLMV